MVMFSVLLLSSCRLYNADEIKQHDGVMLVIGTSNQSCVDYSIDSYLGLEYNIYYDGTIERVLMYYLSGDHVDTTTLSDEDLITFYSFCKCKYRLKQSAGVAFSPLHSAVCSV